MGLVAATVEAVVVHPCDRTVRPSHHCHCLCRHNRMTHGTAVATVVSIAASTMTSSSDLREVRTRFVISWRIGQIKTSSHAANTTTTASVTPTITATDAIGHRTTQRTGRRRWRMRKIDVGVLAAMSPEWWIDATGTGGKYSQIFVGGWVAPFISPGVGLTFTQTNFLDSFHACHPRPCLRRCRHSGKVVKAKDRK